MNNLPSELIKFALSATFATLVTVKMKATTTRMTTTTAVVVVAMVIVVGVVAKVVMV